MKNNDLTFFSFVFFHCSYIYKEKEEQEKQEVRFVISIVDLINLIRESIVFVVQFESAYFIFSIQNRHGDIIEYSAEEEDEIQNKCRMER